MPHGSQLARLLGYQLKDEQTRAAAIKRIDQSFRAKDGNAFQAAEHLGVSHRALMGWIAEHADLRQKLEEARRHAETKSSPKPPKRARTRKK